MIYSSKSGVRTGTCTKTTTRSRERAMTFPAATASTIGAHSWATWSIWSRAGPSSGIMKRAKCLLLLLSCLTGGFARAQPVSFDWFEYTGHDAVFERPLPPGGYRNPILAGFYPDPSVTRVGRKFYLVTSTFTYFPSIPVFESLDL